MATVEEFESMSFAEWDAMVQEDQAEPTPVVKPTTTIVKREPIGHRELGKKEKFRCSAAVFTIYPSDKNEQWTPEGHELSYKQSQIIRYIIGQWEICPKTGRKHFQGYCQFLKRIQGRKVFQKALEGGKFWCQPARGSSEENAGYCSKQGWVGKGNRIEGTEVYEYGKPVKMKGERNDIASVKQMIDSGESMYAVAQSDFKSFVRYHKGFEKYALMTQTAKAKEWRDIDAQVHHGDAGTGKSKGVVDLCKELGISYYRPVVNKNGQVWYSCYKGEKALIIDDFYGQIPFNYLLRLLDGHKLEVETKGGSTWAAWEYVFFTSNSHPREWYGKYQNIPKKCLPGFFRRFKKIVQYHAIEANWTDWVEETHVYKKQAPRAGGASRKRANPFATLVGNHRAYKAAEPLHKKKRGLIGFGRSMNRQF